MIGQTFGRWVVLNEEERERTKTTSYRMWRCHCVCGVEKVIRGCLLRSGNSKSCGCLRRDAAAAASERWFKSLVGKRFGRWIVQHRVEDHITKSGNHVICYECLCDCGVIRILLSSNLKSGHSKSCGCGRSTPRFNDRRQPQINKVISQYKRSATKRGYTWALSYDDAFHQMNSKCHYCGSDPQNVKSKRPNSAGNDDFVYNGIDRIQNTIGYENGNVVPCCKKCNFMKGTLSIDEFVERCRFISEFSRHSVRMEIQ